MIRWTGLFVLTGVWLMFWGNITPILVLGGLLVSTIVMLAFPFPRAMWEGAFRPWAFVVLTARFIFDLVVASVEVAWLALRPRPLGPSAVMEFQMNTRSEFLLTLIGELITLVPGSLLVEMDAEAGKMWLHVLDGENPEGMRQHVKAQERRVIAALGSKTERDAYRSRGERT